MGRGNRKTAKNRNRGARVSKIISDPVIHSEIRKHWRPEDVARRIAEMADTLKRVPVQEIRKVTSSWSTEWRSLTRAHIFMRSFDEYYPASAQAIDRMYETFNWFKYLEDRPELTRALWLVCGRAFSLQRAAFVLDIHRDTVRLRRDEALQRIADGLNNKADAATPLLLPKAA